MLGPSRPASDALQRNGEEIHKLIPHSELTVFEASGHSPQVEERDAFMRRLATFLAR